MAIASQSLRSAETVEDGRKAIEQRLFALGRAHDLLLQANWKSAHLREILNKAIEPFDSETPSRFDIQSSDIEAAASAACRLEWRSMSFAPTRSNTARCRHRRPNKDHRRGR
jgi:two-component sensor histidine kinase